MSKRCKWKFRNKVGIIIGSVGLGIIITFIIPIWIWIIAAGGALVYLGWCWMQKCK